MQLYENPNAKTAFQVATQQNPEFAALNSVVAGMSDAPINAALSQMNMADKFGALNANLLQNQISRKWNKDDADKLYRRGLEEKYQLDLGGLEDISKMDNNRLRQAIYARQLSNMPRQSSPSLQGISNIVDQSGQSVPNVLQNARTSELDIPTFNAKGRLTLDDLPNLGKIYPYLSRTQQGRDILGRIEQTIAQNPDNRSALLPLLAELQQGKIELVPTSRPVDRTPFKGATTLDEKLMKNMDTGSYIFGYPFHRLGQFVNTFGKDYANEAENNAMKYGFVPERQKDVGDSVLGSLKSWMQNRERSKKAEDFVESIKPIHDEMMKKDIRPISVSADDQFTNESRKQLALDLGLNSPYDVQVGVDAYGRNVFYANGGVYLAGNNGVFIKIM